MHPSFPNKPQVGGSLAVLTLFGVLVGMGFFGDWLRPISKRWLGTAGRIWARQRSRGRGVRGIALSRKRLGFLRRRGRLGFPRTVMAARNVDDVVASFLSRSRLRTLGREGCFISRTINVTMIADENRKAAHRYRPIVEPLGFLLRLLTRREAVVIALRLAGGVGKGSPAPQQHITHRLKMSSAASTPSRLFRDGRFPLCPYQGVNFGCRRPQPITLINETATIPEVIIRQRTVLGWTRIDRSCWRSGGSFGRAKNAATAILAADGARCSMCCGGQLP